MHLKYGVEVRVLFNLLMDKLYLNTSIKRKRIKKSFGQQNHYLITTLVALDGLERLNITKSEKFSTSWNPKDVNSSVNRSIKYILDSALVFIIDSLDAYLIEINKKPFLIQDSELKKNIDGISRSVYEKFTCYYENMLSEHNNELPIISSIVALGIQWRNNITHYGASNKFDSNFYKNLKNEINKEYIYDNFCGLRIDNMLDNFNANKSPTFKEVTSIIRAVHKFIEMLDIYLINRLDIDKYFYDILDVYFTKTKWGQFKSLSNSRKKSQIVRLLEQNGFSDCNVNGKFIEITDELINKIVTCTKFK